LINGYEWGGNMFNLDEVIRNTSLVALVEQAGVTLHRAGHEWRGNCPLHGGDNPNAFVIYDSAGKERWHCFTRSECGTGDAVDFVMKLNRCDFPTACRILGGEETADPTVITAAAIEREQRAADALREAQQIHDQALSDLRASLAWERYHDYLTGHAEARKLWRERGIPDDFQNYWQLGYREMYTLTTPAGRWKTPTITMPIFGPGWELVNIRHRLLNPYNPKDKYRPELSGLGTSPFMTDPDAGFDAENILVVEGEIKSMVTYITLDTEKYQVIGIPGKTSFKKIIESLTGKNVVICFDPDANKEAEDAARLVGGRMFSMPIKIDDAILAGALNKKMMIRMFSSARRVK
jgi:hypothetical protein